MGNKSKAALKFFLKFAISGGALFIVFRTIDWQDTWQLLKSAHLEWLGLATVFFVGSKVVSAYRLHHFFLATGLHLSTRYNLRLYWIGMFYNLFLPGGIGGDGYKVYVLNKYFDRPLKRLIQATLLDRVSGMVALVFLAGLGYLFVENSTLGVGWYYADLVGLFILIPLYSWIIGRFFPTFFPNLWTTNFHSLAVQLMQVVSAYFILVSLGVPDLHLEYQVLFLVSSVVAVFPFTIGGVGARELTFILGYQFLGIDEQVAVAFSLLFFLITAFVSALGGFLKVKP